MVSRALNSYAESLVLLSDARVSAESGVPTFRDEGGLWRNYRVEDSRRRMPAAVIRAWFGKFIP
jgi:NAD-dependent SIR2 family protein deacetylase